MLLTTGLHSTQAQTAGIWGTPCGRGTVPHGQVESHVDQVLHVRCSLTSKMHSSLLTVFQLIYSVCACEERVSLLQADM